VTSSTSSRPARTSSQPQRRRPTGRKRPAAPASSGSSGHSRLDAALRAAQERPQPAVDSFTGFGLPDAVVAVLSRQGIERPTAIQASTLPDALTGRDVLGRAQTGSGKTLAFGLPMLTRLAAGPERRITLAPRGLVLVPTRELAQQVADALIPAADAMRMRIGVVVGGTSIGRQMDQLRRGVDVLVATPGRLIDLMERRAVNLDAVEIAVLDEADHMADLGFMPAVTRILDATPPNRQCLLFSATLDQAVSRLVTRYLSDPAIHAAGPTTAPAEAMDHQVFLVDHADKVAVAAEIAARPGRTLFFVRTKHGADRLAKQLTRLGVDSAAIHGNLNQNQRTRALDEFTSGRSRVLTAPDVAGRGLHVDDLDLVVHFDPPEDPKAYLHRSGRTARAGATGTVVSLVEPAQARDTAAMHRAATVAPRITSVRPGHHAVRVLAESGDPITVRPLRSTHDAGSAHGRDSRHRPGGGRRTGDARRSGRRAGPRTGSRSS
jgi:superfamily II DNA/RNA helicase